MNDQPWDGLWDLFHRALEQPPDERAAFLDRRCGDDVELRRRLERLLAAHERSDGVLEDVDRATPRDWSDPLVGQRIGRYRIVDAIGEGGMGIVYDARQEQPVERRVALKLIRPGMDTREIVARFHTERQTLALMDHPSIARMFDAGATDWGRPYVVMEYVDGSPVTDYCDEHRLGVDERLALFLEICDGVQHAHQRGIIHRDLKPSNLLVSARDGGHAVKIIDFGVAKAMDQAAPEAGVTTVGTWIGTPEYMSPEQAGPAARDVDTRSDIYALGMLLYELLAGVLPFDPREFRSSGIEEMRRRIREQALPRPSARLAALEDAEARAVAERRGTDRGALVKRLAGDLDWIVLKALEKERARRYASVTELTGDIRRHLADEPVLAGPPGTGYRLRKFVRRHRFGVAVAAAGLAVLILFASTAAVQATRIARERDRANQEAERASREARTAQRVSEFLVSLFKVADPTTGRRDTMTAREIFDLGAKSLEQQLDDEPEVKPLMLATIGVVYGNLGLYPRSAAMFEKALALRLELHGEEHLEVARALHQLGAARSSLGEFEQARGLYERALAIQDRLLAPDDPQAVETLSALANALKRLGRYREAARIQERVLSVFEATYGPDDARVAVAARDLGLIHVDAKNLPAARAALERALSILERTRGPDDTQVAYVLNGLSIAHWQEENYAAARPLLERSISILEATYTAEHPLTLGLRGNLARLLQDMGDLKAARPLYETTLRGQQKLLGPDHPDLAFTLANLGSLLRDTGDLAAAERLYRRAIRIRETRLGPEHPRLADTLEGYAKLQRARGNAAEAEALERRVLQIREKSAAESP